MESSYSQGLDDWNRCHFDAYFEMKQGDDVIVERAAKGGDIFK